MSETTDPPARRRRADAERSIAAILDAAVGVLGSQPRASLSEVAAAAGVSRQTIYAHYESREALLAAVAERALAEAVEAIDAAGPESGTPSEALERLVGGWWRTVERHARVLDAVAAGIGDERRLHDFHAPILERIESLARRGIEAGDFDRDLDPRWLAVAFLGLIHAAAEEVASGRIDTGEAGRSLERTVPRVFGARE